jgi:hypothetical protein
VLQDIVTKLLASKTGQLIRDGILTLTSNELVVLLLRLSVRASTVIVILHEEGLTWLEAGTRTGESHDVQIIRVNRELQE